MFIILSTVFGDVQNPVNMDWSVWIPQELLFFVVGWETHLCHHEFSRAFPGEVVHLHIFQHVVIFNFAWHVVMMFY